MQNTVTIPTMFVPYILDALMESVKDSTDKRNAAHFAGDFDTASYYKAQLTYYCDAYNALADAYEQR